MIKRLYFILLCALPISGNAQLDLNALKRQSDAKAQERRREGVELQAERSAKWSEFIIKRGEEWAKTIANRDLQWTDFLSESEWTLFDGFLNDKQPEKPKPIVVPYLETEPASKPQPKPIALPPEVVKPAPVIIPEKDIEPEPLPCKPDEPDGGEGYRGC